MDKYVPPFKITNKILEYVALIMEKIGRIDNFNDLSKFPMLRKNNRINSIHSSLAIEANSLTINQVKDIINGKLVLGPQKEIQEVKNAYKAYEEIDNINPYSLDELKRLHAIMTMYLIDEAGMFRSGEEGVFDGEKCIFMAPPQKFVSNLIDDLFGWIKDNKEIIHPLILSSIFHYEFVFIHPFADGNGRIVRLWQTILLSKWRPLFKYIPIENRIKKYQSQYYDSIAKCHVEGESTVFIEFMLKMINETLDDLLELSFNQSTGLTEYVKKILNVMEQGEPITANEIMNRLGLKSKETLRKNYINPSIAAGLISLEIPDKPNSKNQRYIKK